MSKIEWNNQLSEAQALADFRLPETWPQEYIPETTPRHLPAAMLRVNKIKGSSKVHAAIRHNTRLAESRDAQKPNIDVKRTAKNEHLRGPTDPASIETYRKTRMSLYGVPQESLRKDAVLAIEFVVSLPVGTGIQELKFFQASVEWLGARFGGIDNVLTADVHRDESAPHLHVLILPLLVGRMNGSDAVGGPSQLRTLIRVFHQEVAAGFGLGCAPQSLRGAEKEAASRAVLKRLKERGDPLFRSAVCDLILGEIKAKPGPFSQVLDARWPSAPPARLRSMAQVFTSRGKGGNKQ